MESKAREHLRILAAKNKLRREHAERAVSPGAKVRAAKEAAFQTHLRGANNERSGGTNISSSSSSLTRQATNTVTTEGTGHISRGVRTTVESRTSPRDVAQMSRKVDGIYPTVNQISASGGKKNEKASGPTSKWGALDGRNNASTIYFATAGGGKVRVGKPETIEKNYKIDIVKKSSPSAMSGSMSGDNLKLLNKDINSLDIDSPFGLALPSSSYFTSSSPSSSSSSSLSNVFETLQEHAVASNNQGTHLDIYKPKDDFKSDLEPMSPLHSAAQESMKKKIQPQQTQYSPVARNTLRSREVEKDETDILSYLSSLQQNDDPLIKDAVIDEIQQFEREDETNASVVNTVRTSSNKKIVTKTSRNKKKKEVASFSDPSFSRSPNPKQQVVLSPKAGSLLNSLSDLDVGSPRVPISHSPINLEDVIEDNLPAFPNVLPNPPSFTSSPKRTLSKERSRPPASPPPPPPPPQVQPFINDDFDDKSRLDFIKASFMNGVDDTIDPLRSSWMPLPIQTNSLLHPHKIQVKYLNNAQDESASSAASFVDIPSWRAPQSKLVSRLRAVTDSTRNSILVGLEEEEAEAEKEEEEERHISSLRDKSPYNQILKELKESEEDEVDDHDDEVKLIKKRMTNVVINPDDIDNGNGENDEESFDKDDTVVNDDEKHIDPIVFGKCSSDIYLRYEKNNHSNISSNHPFVPQPLLPSARSLTPVPLGSPGAPVLALNFNDSVLSPGSVLPSSLSNIKAQLDTMNSQDSPGLAGNLGETFCIPELPRGRLLRLRILSTWGGDDGGSGGRPMAGLTGVEFFSSTGELIPCTATATRDEIPPTPMKGKNGISPGRDNDYDKEEEEEDEDNDVDDDEGLLTGASKLLNGVNITCDPQHMFRCYFDPPELGAEAEVGFGGLVIEFDFGRKRRDTALAMARIYNYNRSRVHSYCGARLIRMELDGKRIFEGELKRAPGNILGDGKGQSSINALSSCSETILFTIDPEILSRVEANDPQADRLHGSDGKEQNIVDYYLALAALTKVEKTRPTTMERSSSSSSSLSLKENITIQPSLFFRRLIKDKLQTSTQHTPRTPSTLSKKLAFSLTDNDFLGEPEDNDEIESHQTPTITHSNYQSKPTLIVEETDVSFDDNDNDDDDDDDDDDIKPPLQSPSRRQLDINARSISDMISSLDIEGSGTRSLSYQHDDKEITMTRALQPPHPPSTLLSSSIPTLSSSSSSSLSASTILKRLYEPLSLPAGSLLPTGQVFTFKILSTHGDPFYAGLTGIEIMALSDDASTIEKVQINPTQLYAVPSDINGGDDWSDDEEDEENEDEDKDDIGVRKRRGAISSKDVRTVDKLVDGFNITVDDTHMWLIPYSPPEEISSGSVSKKFENNLIALPENRQRHVLTIDLGKRRAVAYIKIWNYNKSFEDSLRGIRHCTIELDNIPLQVPRWIMQHDSHSLNKNNSIKFAPYDVFSIRRAPGIDSFDFGQTLLIAHPPLLYLDSQTSKSDWKFNAPSPSLFPPIPSSSSSSVRQDTLVVQEMPVGQLLRFVFPSGLGDPHYLGLDAIAVYDAIGVRVPVRPRNIHALPLLPNDLSESETESETIENRFGIDKDDSRIASNLGFSPSIIDSSTISCEECIVRKDDPALYLDESSGISSPFPAARSWLYPLLLPHPDIPSRGQGNELVFLLNEPVCISLIRIFNYSKTPARGASSVQVWLDGNLIFLGELQPAPIIITTTTTISSLSSKQAFNKNQKISGKVRPCSSIAFTSNPNLLKGDYENGYISYCGSGEQGVVCYNDGAIVGKLSKKQELAIRALRDSHKSGNIRPKTSLPLSPTTSVVRL